MKAVLTKLFLFSAILLVILAVANWFAKKSICDDSRYKINKKKRNLILRHSKNEYDLKNRIKKQTNN
jgi:hypothetical protein